MASSSALGASSATSWDSSSSAASGSYRYVTAEEQKRLSKQQCDFLERKRAGER
jgi:hypothetical protein